MSWTRRRAALAFLAFSGVAPLLSASAALGEEDVDDGLPNLFISPHGEPFRGAAGAPYPVVDWFRGANKKADGKLDHDEFVADAERFFKRLDLNGDGVLSHYEIQVYEQKLVPEITTTTIRVGQGRARLWLAQYSPSSVGSAPIDPSGDKPIEPHKPNTGPDYSGEGASPYGFFEEPEPVMTADFNVNGIITKDNFLKVADMHFTTLDADQKGFLVLKALPETRMEKLLDTIRHRRRRS
jgi:hypothetical protein